MLDDISVEENRDSCCGSDWFSISRIFFICSGLSVPKNFPEHVMKFLARFKTTRILASETKSSLPYLLA